ncbi:C-type lectin 37Db-like, partial [Drosophila montana]|uniref:C-type lectin 37Db-like n=1 Tax=Drosophila montana TaxID=40370 RepID=UPI00313E9DCA
MIKSGSVLIAFLVCLLTVDANSSLSITCNGNPQQAYRKIGFKYYFIWHTKVSWFEAIHVCRRLGGDLALIESSGEMTSISDFLLSQGYDGTSWLWISGNDLVNNRRFKSVTNGMPLSYTNWSGGQPDNAGGNEHCVHLWLSGGTFKMNDWI